MDDCCVNLVVQDADEQELQDGTPGFQCQCELHRPGGLSGLCMAVSDQRLTAICRTCGLRTFTICVDACLVTLIESVAGFDGSPTCYCSKRVPGHEVVAIMSLTSI